MPTPHIESKKEEPDTFNYTQQYRETASSEYRNDFTVTNNLEPVLNSIWALYQRFDGCFRLPFSTDESMSAFKDYISCGLI